MGSLDDAATMQRAKAALREVARRNSRNEAAKNRDEVMARCGGNCEACGVYCEGIGHSHHVRRAADFGGGEVENLIFLCPNCHTCVHRLQQGNLTKWKLYILSRTIRALYADAAVPEFLFSLADGEVVLTASGWEVAHE